MSHGIQVTVRQGNGTYTVRYKGQTASCTAGDKQVLERLAGKIFGPLQRVSLTCISRDSAVAARWEIRPDDTQRCQACGCSWRQACVTSCYWITPDLCSTCALLGVTVKLEDHGQDFLEFDIIGRRIVATRPLQGSVWNGSPVWWHDLKVGGHVHILRTDGKEAKILYPVAAITLLNKEAGHGHA